MPLQVIPLLQLADVQALSQTCRQTRASVRYGVHVSSWTAVCRSLDFEPGSPPSACHAQLQRLAASQASLLAGAAPAVSASVDLLWPVAVAAETRTDLAPTPDRSATLIASLHEARLQVHTLAPGPSSQLLLSLSSPENSPTAHVRNVKQACWAPDSSVLALVFSVRDPTLYPDTGQEVSPGWAELVYLVRTAALP